MTIFRLVFLENQLPVLLRMRI